MESGNRAKKRALVLSGGGGRGAYHIGVLEYLEEIGCRERSYGPARTFVQSG